MANSRARCGIIGILCRTFVLRLQDCVVWNANCDAFEPTLLEDAIKHAPELCSAFCEALLADHEDQLAKQPWEENPLVVRDTRLGTKLALHVQ